MIHIGRNHKIALLITAASLFTSSMVMADAVTDWNRAAGNIVVNAGMGPLPADRALAIISTAVYEAVNAITKRYPASSLRLEVAPGASTDAAIAAANRTVLTELVPVQQTVIATAYQAALAKIPDSTSKAGGIAAGEEAAKAQIPGSDLG